MDRAKSYVVKLRGYTKIIVKVAQDDAKEHDPDYVDILRVAEETEVKQAAVLKQMTSVLWLLWRQEQMSYVRNRGLEVWVRLLLSLRDERETTGYEAECRKYTGAD